MTKARKDITKVLALEKSKYEITRISTQNQGKFLVFPVTPNC